jgi:hypothetical protein
MDELKGEGRTVYVNHAVNTGVTYIYEVEGGEIVSEKIIREARV